ncbi:MAG TPA: hypothetical protein DD417_15975 [Elusimicrobia bacterium]|nr:hypothetical protein [Elusimicrobiota bacterium]
MSQSLPEASESDDFDRIVASLNEHHVDFMIIGGWAVAYHGHLRMTEDLDIFIRPTEDNAKRAVAALEDAGGACPELKPEVFLRDNGISLGEIPVLKSPLLDLAMDFLRPPLGVIPGYP